MSTVLVEVIRGGRVESAQRGAIAVADATGRLVASAGNPAELHTYLRSAAKPFQALPIITSGAADRFQLTDQELAIAAASHNGEPIHLEVLRHLLQKLELTTADLGCGTVAPIDWRTAARVNAGLEEPSPLYCDCSGKHSGMLAVCKQMGWPLASYKDPTHPLQQQLQQLLAEFLGVDAATLPTATDGCGVPTFYASVAAMARAWAVLTTPPAAYQQAAQRVLDAMGAAPYMVAGRGRICTDLMELTAPAIVVKTGAEAVFCLALREQQLGVAIKIEDGHSNAMPVVVAEVLSQLGAWTVDQRQQFLRRQSPLRRNNAGEVIGEYRPIVTL